MEQIETINKLPFDIDLNPTDKEEYFFGTNIIEFNLNFIGIIKDTLSYASGESVSYTYSEPAIINRENFSKIVFTNIGDKATKITLDNLVLH